MVTNTTKEIQHYLRTLSFYDNRLIPITIDGIYSKQTAQAVEIFQRFYGLPINGEVDSNTWNALNREAELRQTRAIQAELFAHPDNKLYPHQEDELAAFLQIMINSLSGIYRNIDSVSVTGVYDDATIEQIKHLQVLNDLPDTGVVDVDTWNIIASLFNSRIPKTIKTK